MKLKAFTNPVIHAAQAATSKTSTAAGPGRPLTSTTATTALPTAWMSSRLPAASPRMSSVNPSNPKAATAKAKSAAIAPPITPAATSNPAAIGIPPPRGVGTVCEDRGPGMSIMAARRNSGIITASAAATTAPHAATASRLVNSPDTSLPIPPRTVNLSTYRNELVSNYAAAAAVSGRAADLAELLSDDYASASAVAAASRSGAPAGITGGASAR